MEKEAINLDDILLDRDAYINRARIKDGFKAIIEATIYESNISIIEQCFNDKEVVSLNGFSFIIQSYTFKPYYGFQDTNEVFCIIEIILKEIDL